MVTLQILVLPFLVRVRVPQQNKIPITHKSSGWFFSLAKLSSNYRYDSENSNSQKIGDAIVISVLMIPYVMTVDGKGNIVYKHNNYTDGAEMELIKKKCT